MSDVIRRPLVLNVALAAVLILAGASALAAEDPARGRCCKYSVEGDRYCCTVCCTSVNNCESTAGCRLDAW